MQSKRHVRWLETDVNTCAGWIDEMRTNKDHIGMDKEQKIEMD